MIPRLTLSHLSLLTALEATGGVAAAAGRLGITQSAASHRLAEAERRLGAALVRRSGGRVSLTEAGQRLAQFAQGSLPALIRLEQDISAGRSGVRVRMGQATYSRYHWLPVFLATVAASDPDLEVDLAGEATQRPLASLLDHSTDLSIIYGRPTHSRQFVWTRLASDPLVAVMAPDHAMATRRYLDSAALAETHLLSYPVAAEPGFEWEALLGPPTVPLRRLTTMPTPEAVIDLARAGVGVCLFSRWAIEPELADGTLVARPFGSATGTQLEWWVATRASDAHDSPGNRLAAAFARWSDTPDAGMGTLGFARR